MSGVEIPDLVSFECFCVFLSFRDSNAKKKWKYRELLLDTGIKQVDVYRFVERVANKDSLEREREESLESKKSVI